MLSGCTSSTANEKAEGAVHLIILRTKVDVEPRRKSTFQKELAYAMKCKSWLLFLKHLGLILQTP